MSTGTDRERFSDDELANCLANYDIGNITRITEFGKGSRKSPKVIIESDKGKYLFKRRVRAMDDLAKVAFTHQIQVHLAAEGFPLPHLVGTYDDNNSMLVADDSVYEMFEYTTGGPYDGSLESTHDSGRILGLFHKLLENFECEYKPPTGSYHDANAIRQAVKSCAGNIPPAARPAKEVLLATSKFVDETYSRCAEQINALGFDDWGMQIVHGDWHPGNMMFKDRRVVAVIDYDSARLQQRVIDFANGALQFAILGGGEDPATWPQHLDENRFRSWMKGYDSVNVISVAEMKAVPFLMCEAMIAEAALPISATGSFGRFNGYAFLHMIERKVKWILTFYKRLISVLD
ncbi:MAG: phosphotransferase [Planctomycetes bacterium]|nr:phosphotransferase [Planctomycetota bacterium]